MYTHKGGLSLTATTANRPLLKAAALCGLLGVAFALADAPPATALPQNGQIVGGTATFSETPDTLTVTQSSDRLAIDWQSFDIAAGEQVFFNQPSAASIAYNRVTNGHTTLIDGLLRANGRLVVVNGSGIVFGPNATVDAAGLLASTGGLDTAAFMADGTLAFTQPGTATGRIVNHGTLTVAEAGLVGLVAPHVENHGTITARLGTIALASGDRFTVDMAGDGLLELDLGDATTAQSLVNTGTLSAESGRIALSAAAGRDVVDNLLQLEGGLSVSGQTGGVISLAADAAHHAQIGGTWQANGTAGQGGTIRIRSGRIEVLPDAVLTADGATGGGAVTLGGDREGGGTERAQVLFAHAGSHLSANALENGTGGEVILWADGHTRFDGHAEAKGGLHGGDGGFVEVSGEQRLTFNGTVSTHAPAGEDGDVLLDPGEIIVCQFGASANAACNPAGAPELAGSPFDSGAEALSYVNIGASGVAGSLLDILINSANVTVRSNTAGAGNGNITIVDAINSGGVNRTLTFQARGDLIVDAPITVRTLVMEALGDIIINAALTNSGGGNLTLRPLANNVTVGVAGGIGTYNLSVDDLNNIANNWTTVVIGRTTATAAMTVNDYNWQTPVQFLSQTGLITIDGQQTLNGNNLLIQTRALDIAAPITSNGTGILTIQPEADGNTMGIGTGTGGLLNLNDTMLGFIDGRGWSRLDFGRTTATGASTIAARTWQQGVQFRSGTGMVTINGDQNVGANTLILTLRNLTLGGDLLGTGSLIIQPDGAGVAFGVGDGAAGTFQFTNADINRIGDGWSSVTFGRANATAQQTVAAQTWRHPVTFRADTGSIVFDGAQDFGTHNATITNRGTVTINQPFNGTGELTLQPIGTNRTLGVAAAGNQNIDATSLDTIGDTWSKLILGRSDATVAVTLGAYANWRWPVEVRNGTGAITVAGDVDFGANNVVFVSAGNPAINAQLAGTGTLHFMPLNVNTTTGLAGGGGTVNLSALELGRLSGWSNVMFGRADGTGLLRMNGFSGWTTPVTFLNGTGTIRVDGNQDFGAHNVVMQADSTPIWGFALAGTGTFTYRQSSVGTSMGLGSAAGDVQLTSALLNRLSDGWSSLTFGRDDGTAALTLGTHATWRDPVNFRSGGGITIANAQTAQAGTNGGYIFHAPVTVAADLTTDGGDIRFNNTVNGAHALTLNTGTGSVVFEGTVGGTTPLTSLTVTAAGLTLPDTLTTDGAQTLTAPITLTRHSMLVADNAAITLGDTVNGAHSLTLNAGTGHAALNGAIGGTTAPTALTVTADTLAIGAAVTVDGALTLRPATTGRTLGLGAAGDWNLNATELAFLTAQSIRIGTEQSGNLSLDTVTLNSPLLARTAGTTTLNGVVTANGSGDALVLVSGGNVVNTAGAGALVTPNGRYVVYSTAPQNNTLNGLSGFTPLYNTSFNATPPADVTGGNRFVYTFAPVLTVTADPATRQAQTANPDFTATITGLIGNDTLAQAVSGAPTLDTTAGLGSPAGSYPITVGLGSLASAFGYGFVFVDGTLTVTAPPFSAVNVPGQVRAVSLMGQPFLRSNLQTGNTVTIGGERTQTLNGLVFGDRLESMLTQRGRRW